MTVFEILAHIRSIRIQQVHLEVTRQLVPIAATSGPLNQPLCRDSWRATSCPFLRSLLSLSLEHPYSSTPSMFPPYSTRFSRPLTTPSAVTSWTTLLPSCSYLSQLPPMLHDFTPYILFPACPNFQYLF